MSNLARLLPALDEIGYQFVTVTPTTHARFISGRPVGNSVRDLLGWSLPVARDLIPAHIIDMLETAGELETDGELVESRVRVSSCERRLFIHSAFPTTEEDSVFFGPDSYRFVRFLLEKARGLGPVRHLVDFGCGAGVGGIVLAGAIDRPRLTLLDSNEKALRYAALNASHAGLEAELVSGSHLNRVDGPSPDLIIANPPYMVDTSGRTYRDGGDLHGAKLTLDWAREAVQRLAPGGSLLLYSGSAILDGRDRLREHLEGDADRLSFALSYEEIDPDVFGEQLEEPAYAGVERIAAIGAVLKRLA